MKWKQRTQIKRRRLVLDEVDTIIKQKVDAGEVRFFSKPVWRGDNPDVSRFNIWRESFDGSAPQAMLKVANVFNLSAKDFVRHCVDLESHDTDAQPGLTMDSMINRHTALDVDCRAKNF